MKYPRLIAIAVKIQIKCFINARMRVHHNKEYHTLDHNEAIDLEPGVSVSVSLTTTFETIASFPFRLGTPVDECLKYPIQRM